MSTQAPQPKPWVAKLAPYEPGKSESPGAKRVIKLSSNESVFGPSPKAIAALEGAAARLRRYPEPTAAIVREALAAAHDIDPNWIICGAGSDEILHLAVQAYAGPGDRVLHSRFGFMMYPISARAVGAEPIAIPNKNWAGDVEGILAAVDERTRVVFLDNPNNPTGACLGRDAVWELAERLPRHVLLVYDAAYAECVTRSDYEDGIALAKAFPHVLATRTFSKAYALAALRIGWAVGRPELLDPIHRIRPPFNVNQPAQEAAVAALGDHAHLKQIVSATVAGRQQLEAGLTRLGLEVVPSQTNFVLARFPADPARNAEAANRYLMREGIILRWLPGQGLADCLRITVGTEDENAAVIAAIEAFLARSPATA